MKNVIKPTTKWDDWRTEIEVAQKCTIEKMAGVYMVPELTAPQRAPALMTMRSTQVVGVTNCFIKTVRKSEYLHD